MTKTTFSLGQKVYRATFESEDIHIQCPDCGGTRFFTVELWDGTKHTIDCQGCARGYEPPTGVVWGHKRTPRAKAGEISCIELSGDKEEYAVSGDGHCYRCPPEDLATTEAGALKIAQKKAAAFDREELEKISQKKKADRNWSWNVYYHRKSIRGAEKQIKYHTAKLEAARPQASAERKAKKEAKK